MGKLKETTEENKTAEVDEQKHPEITESSENIESKESPEQTEKRDAKDEPSKGRFAKYKAKIRRVVTSKKFKIAVPIVILVVLALVAFVEPVRFGLLNLFSDGSAEVVVVDESTLVPIEKASVTIGKVTGITKQDGKVQIKGVKYGKNTYIVSKDNYTALKGSTNIKTGTNLVGPVKLHSEGVPVTVKTTNTLTKGVVKSYKVSIKGTEVSSLSDEEGTAILKVPADSVGEIAIEISSDGFNTKALKANVKSSNNQPIAATLTPAGKHYFLSNRAGKVAVYSSDLDGANQSEVISGGTNNDTQTSLLIAPDNKHAVLISKRDGQRGVDGKIQPAVFAVDLENKTIKRVDEGAPEFIGLGWASNTQFIYYLYYNNYERSDNTKLKTVDVTSGKLATIHSTKDYASYMHYDDDRDHVYFSAYNQNVADYGFYSVTISSKAKTRLHGFPAEDYKKIKSGSLSFIQDNKWYDVTTDTQKVQNSTEPAGSTRGLVLSPNKQKFAWVESRDGKGSVIIADKNDTNQKQITKGMSATYISRWLSDDYIIFRVQNSNESADYIVHHDSGTVTKIADVYSAPYTRY